METWPSYAKALLSGYSLSDNHGINRTPMDSGIPKQKSRYSVPMVTRQASVILSKADMLAFRLWMKDNLHGGSDWFWYQDCSTDGQRKTHIVDGKVDWSTNEGWWVGSMQLEMIGG